LRGGGGWNGGWRGLEGARLGAGRRCATQRVAAATPRRQQPAHQQPESVVRSAVQTRARANQPSPEMVARAPVEVMMVPGSCFKACWDVVKGLAPACLQGAAAGKHTQAAAHSRRLAAVPPNRSAPAADSPTHRARAPAGCGRPCGDAALGGGAGRVWGGGRGARGVASAAGAYTTGDKKLRWRCVKEEEGGDRGWPRRRAA